MRIVVDTNVLISGIFFGGAPRKVLNSVINKQVNAYATVEIINEYQEILQEMIDRKQGHLDSSIISPLICAMEIIETKSRVSICRDPDDDKFLGCAIDSSSLYVISGDKDLLVIGQYKEIEVITAKEFCERYLLY